MVKLSFKFSSRQRVNELLIDCKITIYDDIYLSLYLSPAVKQIFADVIIIINHKHA